MFSFYFFVLFFVVVVVVLLCCCFFGGRYAVLVLCGLYPVFDIGVLITNWTSTLGKGKQPNLWVIILLINSYYIIFREIHVGPIFSYFVFPKIVTDLRKCSVLDLKKKYNNKKQKQTKNKQTLKKLHTHITQTYMTLYKS